MPDAARIAQALEVPLILQWAKIADGTDRRELFKENATTTLVFENGAALNLRAKVAVGQIVFVHNQQNGREILCKVLEAPPEGEAGCTDLEFTTVDPEFWDANAQPTAPSAQNSPAAAEKPETNEQPAAPADDTLAMMGGTAANIHLPNMVAPGKQAGGSLREELMPAYEMAPDSSAAPSVPVPDFEPAATTETVSSVPSGEQIDAVLRQMSGAPRPASPPAGTEANPENDEKHLSALMERDTRLAKFAAFKEKQADKLQRDAAAKDAAKAAPASAPEADFAAEPTAGRAKMSFSDTLTRGKNATYATIGAAVLIAVALGFVWNAMRGAFIHPSDLPVASTTAQPTPTAAPTANPATPATAPAASGVNPPAVTRQPDAAPARPSRAEMRTARSAEEQGDTDAAQRKHRKPEASGDVIEPAVVLSQPQPTLPPWAVGMEVDGVVRLDVVIDEKGNVSDTRVLSGPRALQHEAERAIGLWVFEPARSDGRAIPSHLTLSVEFLPPPPPKRFP